MDLTNKLIKTLCYRKIVSATADVGQCKQKIVELGITIPEGKTDCILYWRQGQEAMYIFVCFRDPARNLGDHGFVGLRFDFAQYRREPLAPDVGLREACVLFSNAVAEWAEIDLKKCTWAVGRSGQN